MREAAVREAGGSLSPAVEAAVAEALDSRMASLPVVLTRASAKAAGSEAEIGGSEREGSHGIEVVSTAVASLSGYAHLRRDLLASPEGRDRTVALLASDYLHASAHAALGVAAVPSERRRELYVTLTAGSAALATSLFAASDRDGASPERGPPAVSRTGEDAVVAATLAETGCALGAAVGTASRETVEAMAAYGRSLVTAAGRSETPLERIETAVAGDRPAADGEPADGPADGHLERAREALETLPEGEARERLERATRVLERRSSE